MKNSDNGSNVIEENTNKDNKVVFCFQVEYSNGFSVVPPYYVCSFSGKLNEILDKISTQFAGLFSDGSEIIEIGLKKSPLGELDSCFSELLIDDNGNYISNELSNVEKLLNLLLKNGIDHEVVSDLNSSLDYKKNLDYITNYQYLYLDENVCDKKQTAILQNLLNQITYFNSKLESQNKSLIKMPVGIPQINFALSTLVKLINASSYGLQGVSKKNIITYDYFVSGLLYELYYSLNLNLDVVSNLYGDDIAHIFSFVENHKLLFEYKTSSTLHGNERFALILFFIHNLNILLNSLLIQQAHIVNEIINDAENKYLPLLRSTNLFTSKFIEKYELYLSSLKVHLLNIKNGNYN